MKRNYSPKQESVPTTIYPALPKRVLRPKTLPPYKILFAILLVVLCGCLVLSLTQQTQGSGRDIIGPWDFTGWTEEEKATALSVLQPSKYQDWEKKASRAEIKAAEQSALAITNPVLFTQIYGGHNNGNGRAAKEEAIDAITHPREAKAKADAKKSKQELDEDAFSLWAITHPDEFTALVKPLKTPQDEEEEEAELQEIANPSLFPPLAFPDPPQEGRPF